MLYIEKIITTKPGELWNYVVSRHHIKFSLFGAKWKTSSEVNAQNNNQPKEPTSSELKNQSENARKSPEGIWVNNLSASSPGKVIQQGHLVVI